MNSQVGRRVSIKSVIASVIRNLDISDASKMSYSFVEWAFEAEKKNRLLQNICKKNCYS